jgi:hypothetical protein
VVLADIELVKPLIKQWPPYFKALGDAKRYVRKICEKNNFRFKLSHVLDPSRARGVVFTVIALDAVEAGKFKIDKVKGISIPIAPYKEPAISRPAVKPTVSRSVIQQTIDALQTVSSTSSVTDTVGGLPEVLGTEDLQTVSSSIKRIYGLVTDWPPHFEHLKDAKDYLRQICLNNGLKFSPFEGRTPSKTSKYFCGVVATDAFREGAFTADDHPYGYMVSLAPVPAVQQILDELHEQKRLSTIDDSSDVPTMPRQEQTRDLFTELMLSSSGGDRLDVSRVVMPSIRQIQTLIPHWGPQVKRIKDGRKYIKNICKKSGFKFTSLDEHRSGKIRKFLCDVITIDASRIGAFALLDNIAAYIGALPQDQALAYQQALEELQRQRELSLGSPASSASATAVEDEPFEEPAPPTPMSNSNFVKPTYAIDEEPMSIIDIRAEQLAARFDMANKMMSRLGLDPVDKKAREMEERMARAEQNLSNIGFRGQVKEHRSMADPICVDW